MTFLLARVASTRGISYAFRRTTAFTQVSFSKRWFRSVPAGRREEYNRANGDPRINDLGRAIEDDFATIREKYGEFRRL